VGHGNLAERALAPAVPPRDEWPYTVHHASALSLSPCGVSNTPLYGQWST
jgi:polyribonucleotide nucleotidyltransferase